jgi:hypothetical protein
LGLQTLLLSNRILLSNHGHFPKHEDILGAPLTTTRKEISLVCQIQCEGEKVEKHSFDVEVVLTIARLRFFALSLGLVDLE